MMADLEPPDIHDEEKICTQVQQEGGKRGERRERGGRETEKPEQSFIGEPGCS